MHVEREGCTFKNYEINYFKNQVCYLRCLATLQFDKYFDNSLFMSEFNIE